MNNFAVLDLKYTHYENGLYVCLKTDRPCHLTCYWTFEKPGRHRTSRNQRGLTLPWGVYFCFVAWKPTEQMEEGDTIFHHFNLFIWQPLNTAWLAFRGTIAGELSPSVSPIFEHWHPGGLPMEPKLDVYWPGDICSPALTGTGPPCPDHWKSVTTKPGYPPEWHLIGDTINQWWAYDSYKIERGRLEKIESVTLWEKWKRIGGPAYVHVCGFLLRIADTTYRTEERDIYTEWQYYSKEYPLNPHTNLPWTQQDLDNLQIGVNLRHAWGVGWASTGYCDEVYLKVKRSIICPDD